jgi:hypothetical protein
MTKRVIKITIIVFYAFTNVNTQGVRSRSSLSLLPGLEFLDAIVSNCLDWLPSNRPTTASLLHFLAVNAPPGNCNLTRLEAPASATTQSVVPLRTTQPSLQPSLASQSSTSNKVPNEQSGDAKERSSSSKPNARREFDPSSSPLGSKTSQAVTASEPGEPASSVSRTGNPAYGPCEVGGCENYKLRKHIFFCWQHRDRLLPSEMLIARALQKEGLLNVLHPCDLVSCVSLAGRCQSLYGGLLTFAVVSALKVPSASVTFVTELEKASKQDATHFVAALAAASSPQQHEIYNLIIIVLTFKLRLTVLSSWKHMLRVFFCVVIIN